MSDINENRDKEWADRLGMEYTPPTPPPPFNPENIEPSENPENPVSPNPASPNPGATGAPDPYMSAPPMPQNYLLWSILAAIFCCTVPAIVAIIYGSIVSTKYWSRDYEGAQRASHTAEIWIIVSIVLGVISFPLSLIFTLF